MRKINNLIICLLNIINNHIILFREMNYCFLFVFGLGFGDFPVFLFITVFKGFCPCLLAGFFISVLLVSVFTLFFAEFIFSFGILEGDILITGPCFCLGLAKIIFFLITPLPGFGDIPFFNFFNIF